MEDPTFQAAVEALGQKDARYDTEAYYFLREALEHTLKTLSEKEGKPIHRHVTGQELLDGFRTLALDEFGPLTFTVLDSWGLHRTEDVGELVFNLVGAGVFGKTPKDSRADFANGYDFETAFHAPFEPASASD